jgi:tetratricopeptide (TPR) repeat protein
MLPGAGGLPKCSRRDAGIVFALAALCLAVYGRTACFPFVNYDDPHFISENPFLAGGLSLEGIRWAFTTDLDTQWIPLTWLSRLLDVSLFGMNAGGHHLVNALIHLANAILLYALFRRMTGREMASALVAALFAVHPLHVESVAWVTERKDLLGGFFFLACLLAYVRYCDRPTAARYLAALFLFALGLLSKPTVVTLPFVLLLLDLWPLGRLRHSAEAGPGARPPGALLLEKLPFAALSAISCAILLAARSKVPPAADVLPPVYRAGNALLSAATYVRKAAWPSGLAVFYPHPGQGLSASRAVLAGLFLCAASAWTIAQLRRRPWLFVGWSWFLGMLVPVLGLVPLGNWGMADRYTYLPLIGLSILPACFLDELGARPAMRRAVPAAAIAWLLALAALSCLQVGYWRDSVPLFEHAIEVTGGNPVAHNQLGRSLDREGRTAEAIPHLREALRAFPDFAEAHHNLAVALVRTGRSAEAEFHFRETIRIAPAVPDAYNNLGVLVARAGKRQEAAALFREALRLRPGYAEARANLERSGKGP